MSVPSGVFSYAGLITDLSGAVDQFVWTMRAGASKKIWIRSLKLKGYFIGTTAKTLSQVAICKWDKSATANEATWLPTAHSSRWATATTTTAIYNQVLAAGLANPVNTKVKGTALGTLVIPSISIDAQVATAQNSINASYGPIVTWEREYYRHDLDWPHYWEDELELAPGTLTTGTGTAEGLGILTVGTPVAGSCVSIEISWDEEA